MVIFKITISDPKTGKSYKKELETEAFKGKIIGNKVKGDELGFKDYELEITGASDTSGFPSLRNLPGAGRKEVLLSKGAGVKIKRAGLKLRKTVVGNQISLKTSQVNLKITKHGSESIEKILGIEPKKEEAKEQNEAKS
ncbi:MAG: S6e family ribosomal protein [Candidatus Nanoarchaeia archaeon]|nr:S6e family ribosomal protein [Candidatus Nanoarchaeia archaeon]